MKHIRPARRFGFSLSRRGAACSALLVLQHEGERSRGGGPGEERGLERRRAWRGGRGKRRPYSHNPVAWVTLPMHRSPGPAAEVSALEALGMTSA